MGVAGYGGSVGAPGAPRFTYHVRQLRMAERRSQFQWHLHESTARGLCRWGFMVFGLAPLVVCLVWSLQVFWPVYQRQQAGRWEQFLSSQLGAQLKIAAVETLAPQRFALHELRLLHPETGVELARARRAEVHRGGGKWQVRLSEAELEGGQLATTLAAFHDWCLCRPKHVAHATRVEISQVTVHHAGQMQILQQVTCDLLPGSQSTALTVKFQAADHPGPAHPQAASLEQASGSQENAAAVAGADDLGRLLVKRYHLADGLKTELQLQTGSNGLAAWLLSPLSPVFAGLGESATLAGGLSMQASGRQWQLAMTQVRLLDLDLQRLTGDSVLAVSGNGSVLLEELLVGDGGLEAVRGRGEFRDGKMTPEVFYACGRYLGVIPRETNRVSFYWFDRCDVAFDLRQPNLHLFCALQDALGVLAARGQEQWQEPLPLENVVAALQSCAAAPRSAEGSGLAASWLAKQALLWLPLGEEQVEAMQAKFRLSAHQQLRGQGE